MNEYTCKICNYITKERSNLNRHFKSTRHIKKVTNADNVMENKHIKKSHNNSIQKLSLNYQQSTDEVPTKYRPKSSRACPTICKYCSGEFTRIDSLSKHLKTCTKKYEKERILEEQIKIWKNETN